MAQDVQTRDLPGVGRRYDFGTDRTGQRISIVDRGGGKDLYVFTATSRDPVAVFELSDRQARTIAAVLAGTYFT